MEVSSFGTDPRPVRDARFGRGKSEQEAGPVWCLHLVNRVTGDVLRLNGMPLVIYTRDASEGVASLLEDRDPRQWRAEVSRVEGPPRRL